MSASIAAEAQTLVRSAAAPVAPGETIKAQLRRSCRALGFQDGNWRIRAAWYGEAACWSAAALEDLRARFGRWQAKEKARANEAQKTAFARFAAMRDVLAATDPDFHREEIARLERILGQLRDGTDAELKP